jgi:thioredoxin-related protein
MVKKHLQQFGGKVTLSVFFSAVGVLGLLFFVYVMTKKKEGFQEAKAKVIYFYNDGCGYCKRFEPEWKKFEASASSVGVKTEKVQPSENMELAKKYQVQGTPTIIMVMGEKTVDLSQHRTSAELVAQVKKNLSA